MWRPIVRVSPETASFRRGAVAVVLTFAAGFVDGFGFLTLKRVYVANMSGNSVQIGLKAAGQASGTALLDMFAVGMFLLGLVLGSAAIELGRRAGIRRIFAVAMTLEIAGLALLMAAAPVTAPHELSGPILVGIALAALTMGLQNTSLRMAGILTTYTTHVTGTITRFSEDLVTWLFGPRGDAEQRRGARRGAALSGTLWVAFVLGSFAAAGLLPLAGRAALFVPLVIAFGAGLTDIAGPLSPSAGDDDRDQP